MYRRGRPVAPRLADVGMGSDCGGSGLARFAGDVSVRLRAERRDAAKAMRSKPRARPGPTTAGTHSTGRDGSDGGAAGSDGAPGPVGPGAAPPNSGAHATIGAPPPAPCAPLDPATVTPCATPH